MDIKEFAFLVRSMRDKQREWFNRDTRRPSTLEESKALERQVDRAVREVLDDHPSLFAETDQWA